nr:NADH dehydrogenase subunit 2 [Ipomoea batatas]
MAREAHAERARRKRSVEEKQPSSFPSLPESKARTWILYEPMDRDKSLLLAMTSSFITSFFPYPSPLFSVTHQMALSSYL